LWLFYGRVDVVGRERIPAHGGVVVAANHHNSVVDAMLIVAVIPRPVTVLANAPLFRHPLIGPFLRMMRAVPVQRRAEAGDDPRKNDAMFAAAVAALRRGGVILIFPEGRTQPQPVLLPLRTGAARMVLGAANDPGESRPVTLLPVGIVFHDPGTFRSGSVQVMIGAPVPTADVVETHRAHPEDAVRLLTARLTEAIRARIVEAEDRYTLELLAVLERAWRQEQARPSAVSAPDDEESLSWKQRVMSGARDLAGREPQRVAALRRRIELYRSHLDALGIAGDRLGLPYTARGVAAYVTTNLSWLALGLPLALWGMACHLVPYAATGRVVKWLDRTAEEDATDKIAVGLVLYPLAWLGEGGLVGRTAGPWGAAAFAALLVPSGLLALAWRRRLGEVAGRARAFLRFVADREVEQRLLEERRGLVDELRALAERHAG
jgi:glycerol-3-phosphate O-acyltransferase / dihydroxyacetone phosphate acyltransferase